MTEFLSSRFKITATYDMILDFYSPAFIYKALGCVPLLHQLGRGNGI